MLPAVMEAGAVPVDVTVRVFVAVEPIGTLPKLRLVALAEREGLLPGTPFPWTFTLTAGVVAELVDTVIVPVASPSAVGSNFNFKDICWFGCKTWGRTWGEPVNSAPTTVIEVTVTGPAPFDTNVMVLEP
jgi:hypothetical protein